MADNVVLNAGAGGSTLATDDVAGVHYQRVKLVSGTLEATDAIPGDATNGLDVDVTRLPALVAGAANIGDVDVATTVNPANRTASGALGALEAAVTVNAEGAGSIHWEIDTGTLAGTVTPEATLDDTNWFGVNAIENNGNISGSYTSFGKRGLFVSGGYSQVRLRVSAYTSGTSNARLEAAGSTSIVRLGQALPTGTNNIGDVDILTLPTVTVAGDVAHDGVDSGNPVKVGARAVNAEPTAVANADRVNLIADLVGKLITLPYSNPENFLDGTGNATGTADTAVIAAQGGGVRIYVTALIVHNSSATDTFVNVKDGVTTKLVVPAPNKGGAVIPLPVPLKLTANTALNFASAAAVTTMYVSAVGYKGV